MRASIVIPVYNEEDGIADLAGEICAVKELGGDFELLLVDDGSRDRTWDRIVAAAKLHPQVRGLRCPRNQGQSSAMLHGLLAARGQIVVTMDGDLQNNPADIPVLLAKVGPFDVVCGYRAKRRDSWSRRLASRIGNGARNWVTHDGIRDTGCSLKAFRRELIEDLPWVNGVHRFMPAYFKLHGRSVTEVPVDHRPRRHGTSKYTNLKRLPRGIFDLIGFAWYRSRILRRMEVSSTDPG